MEQGQLNWVANFIWGIADDVLRDLYVRGKYRDVILPMTVLRRLDAVLEPTKQAVLEMKRSLDRAKITNQDQAIRQAAEQAFYNTSKFTLRDLKARANQQQLKADFEAYLDGFSPNVQDILDNFEFRNQIPRLSKADALGTLIEKLLSPDIDLSPKGLDIIRRPQPTGLGSLCFQRFGSVEILGSAPRLAIISTNPSYSARSRPRSGGRAWRSGSAAIRSVTHLRRICSKTGMTFERCRNCSATRMSARP